MKNNWSEVDTPFAKKSRSWQPPGGLFEPGLCPRSQTLRPARVSVLHTDHNTMEGV